MYTNMRVVFAFEDCDDGVTATATVAQITGHGEEESVHEFSGDFALILQRDLHGFLQRHLIGMGVRRVTINGGKIDLPQRRAA